MDRDKAPEIIKDIEEECRRTNADCEACIHHEILGKCPLGGNPEIGDI